MYTGIIYCALFPNNKKYYGKTKNSLSKRIKKHLIDCNNLKDNLLFHRAIRKYKNSIEWIEVENFSYKNKVDLINKLNEREIYWIEKDKTYVLKYGIKYGYNLTPGGDGGDTFLGKKHTPETILKMKNSRLKYLETHDHAMKGKKRPEHSKKMKGKNNPMYGKGELICGEKNGMFKKSVSEETRKKQSDAKKGKTYEEIMGVEKSKETRKKQSDAKRGKQYSKEHKENLKISANRLKQCEYCHKIIKVGTFNRWHGENCKLKNEHNPLDIIDI